MNHSRQLFPMTGAVLAVLLLSSCASSERMNRMSGILGSYEKPRGERIAGFPARESGDTLSPLDDSLINLWPFFYRNHLYTSLLWPMIDSDPYGFAVRPFYNQEGNEYSVLFPLCAWNPVNGDGWLASVYWNRKGFGAFPLFHHPRNPQELACYTLFWRCGGNYGIFPLARFGTGISYTGPAWWFRSEDYLSGGIFPLARFSTENNSLNYAGPIWLWGKSFGVFPVFRYTPEELSHVGPFWKDAFDHTFGIFPIFRYRNALDHFVFPLYSISRNGKRFFSPLAAWNGDKMISILGTMYIKCGNVTRNAPNVNPMFSPGNIEAARSFRMFGLLGYSGNRTRFQWKKECDLRYLNSTRMDSIRKHRPYLAYQLEKLGCQDRFPETEAEVKALKNNLRDFTVRQEENYFGVAPLFHYETSPAEEAFRFLLFFPHYRHRKGREKEFSILEPFLFRLRETQYTDPHEKISALERGHATAESFFFSLPLLGGIRAKTYYTPSPEREILRKLIAHSRAKEPEIEREKVDAELRKLSPALALPNSVTDGESLRAFLADASTTCHLPVRTEWNGGFLPLFFKTGKDSWVIPPLLSGWEHTEKESSFLSLPLLTFVKESRKETVRNFLFPFGWMESETQNNRDTAFVCEADDILDNSSYVKESGFGVLLHLYHQNENSVLVATRKGEAAHLNKLRSLLRVRIRRLNELARTEKEIRSLRPLLEQAMAKQTGKAAVLPDADACRNTAVSEKGSLRIKLRCLESRYREAAKLREDLLSSEKELTGEWNALEIPADHFDMDSVKALQSCFDSLYENRIRECMVRKRGTWFAGAENAENASHWNIAWILADGRKSAGREEVRVLRYLYRYRRNGNRSETLLPFYSLQKDGENRRVSFFWRIWERRTVNGRTGGHIFFIPYGE